MYLSTDANKILEPSINEQNCVINGDKIETWPLKPLGWYTGIIRQTLWLVITWERKVKPTTCRSRICICRNASSNTKTIIFLSYMFTDRKIRWTIPFTICLTRHRYVHMNLYRLYRVFIIGHNKDEKVNWKILEISRRCSRVNRSLWRVFF